MPGNDPARRKRQIRVNTGRIIDRKSGGDVLRRIIKLGMHMRYASMRSTGFGGFLSISFMSAYHTGGSSEIINNRQNGVGRCFVLCNRKLLGMRLN
jgi:hypothetical protein